MQFKNFLAGLKGSAQLWRRHLWMGGWSFIFFVYIQLGLFVDDARVIPPLFVFFVQEGLLSIRALAAVPTAAFLSFLFFLPWRPFNIGATTWCVVWFVAMLFGALFFGQSIWVEGLGWSNGGALCMNVVFAMSGFWARDVWRKGWWVPNARYKSNGFVSYFPFWAKLDNTSGRGVYALKTWRPRWLFGLLLERVGWTNSISERESSD